MNRSFPFSLAAVRTRSSPGDTLARLGVRRVLACPVFSSAPSLRSTNFGSGRPSPFAGLPAAMCRVGRGGAYRPASARSLKRLVQFSRKPLSYVGRADWRRLGRIPPASDGAFPVSSIPAQGLSQSELIRTSVMYSPGLHHLTPPHSTGPPPSGWSFGANRRRRSMVAIRNLLF